VTQFVKGGPDIPDHLLQAHEDGEVVLFCGAGISYPACLPGFDRLTQLLFHNLVHDDRSAVEEAAMSSGLFDTAIGLLEGRIVGGRETVRREVASLLRPNLSATGATATHEALLDLAQTRKGRWRLVTTNFDRLFEHVRATRKLGYESFEAPLLPIPKRKWDGVVYLHGLLGEPSTLRDQERLILSSGDFGRAYLTERWAARFVSELFRAYTVCFIGYSINDPVLRYMMDALAADRQDGEPLPTAFVFGDCRSADCTTAKAKWEAKGVVPILYSVPTGTEDHSLLHLSLREWADTYREGALGKKQIVAKYAQTKPIGSTKEDDFAARMLWALRDRDGLPAKLFADLDPLPPIDWLGPLSEPRFAERDLPQFGVTPSPVPRGGAAFSLLLRPSPYDLSVRMSPLRSGDVGGWDDVMWHLARWLARHVAEKKLILWVARSGTGVDMRFARLVSARLKTSSHRAVRTLWSIILAGRLHRPGRAGDMYEWRDAFKSDGLTPSLRIRLREMLSPCVVLREPFRFTEGLEDRDSADRLRSLVDWEIRLRADHAHIGLSALRTDDVWRKVLPSLLNDASTLLRDTMELMQDLEGADSRRDYSYVYKPSISPHGQNRQNRDWVALIDLTTDAWKEASKVDPESARAVARSWRAVPFPLFQRLAMWAAAESDLISSADAVAALTDDGSYWLWAIETHRETMRLLSSLGPRLAGPDAAKVEAAILRGPHRGMFRQDLTDPDFRQLRDHGVWLRLAKLRGGGAKLGETALEEISRLERDHADWVESPDQMEEFPSWSSSGTVSQKVEATPVEMTELISWVAKNEPEDFDRSSDWAQRCRRNPFRMAVVLARLAKEQVWPDKRWRDAIRVWSDEAFHIQSWEYLSPVLTGASTEFLGSLGPTFTGWLEGVGKTHRTLSSKPLFDLVREVLLFHRTPAGTTDGPNELTGATTDHISKALNSPVGHVTQALLNWWFNQAPSDDEPLADGLKDLLSNVADRKVASFRDGRVLLCTNVVALYRADREWCEKWVLPLFDWSDASEAVAAWQGFLWSPRFYLPLMERLKVAFLATASHHAELGDMGERYAEFLTFTALESGDLFASTELAAATRALPPEGLDQASNTLARALDGAGEQGAQIWARRIAPYLNSVWPQDHAVRTVGVSANFARVCVLTGTAFPEAFRRLRRWLAPVPHPGLLADTLAQSRLCKDFPEEALEFLDLTTDKSNSWPDSELRRCLELITGEKPETTASPAYKALDTYLQRNGM